MVGGPEVSRDNDWVLSHPAVDMAVMGEGEPQFGDALCKLSIDFSGKKRGKSNHFLAATIFGQKRKITQTGISVFPQILM